MQEPYLLEEMVTSLEKYEPPLDHSFIAAYCDSPNDVYLAADTLRFALMVYAELPDRTRTELLSSAMQKRSLGSVATGGGGFALDECR